MKISLNVKNINRIYKDEQRNYVLEFVATDKNIINLKIKRSKKHYIQILIKEFENLLFIESKRNYKHNYLLKNKLK